jgi:GT2 family glycosyltransferase
LDYDSNEVQTVGASGFDLFGLMVGAKPGMTSHERFAVGTFFFVSRALFEKLGGFDDEYFLYCEELDLSWRAWIAGEPVVLIPTARLHHQAASTGDRMVENRTNESRRFYANRNQLLTIFKNSHGPLLLLALTQILLIAAEAAVGLAASRRLSFVRWALLKPIADCWRLRHHIAQQRQYLRRVRRHGDVWILRHFFRFGFGRWGDVKRLLKFGVKIDPAKPAK